MDNLVSLMATLGIDLQESSLQLVLPVGISFYTFQTLSYSIDVYKKRIEPTSDFIAFAAFVSFFPQLVAGPIERASNLLPQFLKKREFTYDKAVDGMRQILWGLFKKIVIADNAAHYVNDIFSNYWNYNGSTLLLGGVFFALQIYGDFSGYSDVAIGVSRVFGFSLKRNFAFPYFSRDIAEFWRRWHISLSSWFRDYLYIPIGGSQGSRVQQARNILLIFVVSGLWHGANWTFIGWGLLNAIFIIPLILNGSNRRNVEIVALGKLFPTLKELISMMATFMLTTFAWILFRSESITHAFQYYRVLFSSSLLLSPIGDLRAANTGYHIIYLLFSIVILMSVEWIQRSEEHGLRLDSDKIHKAFRWIIYYIIVIMCIAISGVQQEFIYFQF